MFLVVRQCFFSEYIFIDELLELKQGSRFMSAYIAKVIGAGAPYKQRSWVFIFLDVYFVEGGVVVVLHSESDGAHQVIVFEEFNIANGMYLFASSYDFVSAVVVDEF